VSAASVRRDVTRQVFEASETGVCPRWRCPCVESQRPALFFASKRHDSTSHFRRTVLSAARVALPLTQNVLSRIVSHAYCRGMSKFHQTGPARLCHWSSLVVSFRNSTTWTQYHADGPQGSSTSPPICLIVDLSTQSRHVQTSWVWSGVVGTQIMSVGPRSGI